MFIVIVFKVKFLTCSNLFEMSLFKNNNFIYKKKDIEMMVRTSKEFNFSIAAFHHALEAYRIPEALKDNNIVAATFADHWGFKHEAYLAIVYSPKILRKAGVKVALKTGFFLLKIKTLIKKICLDHPVL